MRNNGKTKRVLLINPPYERLKGFSVESIPLGLLYIATVLKGAGYDVKVYDADTDFSGKGLAYTNVNRARSQKSYREALKDKTHPCWSDLKRVIGEYSPDFVGVTMMTPAHSSCREVFKIAKETSNAVLLAGGPHVTITGAKVMDDNPEIDFAFSGEAEYALCEFMKAYSGETPDFSRVKGLMYRQAGEVRFNGKADRIDELDRLPVPDRGLLHNSEKYGKDRLSLMVGSRGCPFSCAFCASVPLWERKVRLRSPKNIMKELDHLVQRYDTSSFGFWDDTFTTNRRCIMEFCGLVEKKYGARLSWDCLTSVNCLDEEVLKALKRSGCKRIRIGVESGSDDILRKIKKNITTAQVMKAAGLIRRHGFWLHAYFMVGMPHETEGDLRKTIDFIKELDPDSLNLCTFTPYPGTELYDHVLEHGLMPPGADYSIYDSIGHHSTDSFFLRNIEREDYMRLLDEALKAATDISSRWTARKLLLKARMATPDKIRRAARKVLSLR